MAALLYLEVIGLATTMTCGLTATFAPNRFANSARFWGRWVETRPNIPLVDCRFDIDEFVLRYTRLFGATILTAATMWTLLLFDAI